MKMWYILNKQSIYCLFKGGVQYMHDKEEKEMEAFIQEKSSVRESIIESLKEVELMRQGKLPKKTWREIMKEIREELEEER